MNRVVMNVTAKTVIYSHFNQETMGGALHGLQHFQFVLHE